MLGVQQGDLGNANYLMDAIFEQIFYNMNNPRLFYKLNIPIILNNLK